VNSYVHISHQPATYDEDRLLADEAKVVERIDNLEHSIHSFVKLAALDDLEGGREVVRIKVAPDLLAVHAEDDLVNNNENTAPASVTVREVFVLSVEDTVKDLETVVDILDTLNMCQQL
jgi:hypothetical protein